MDNKVSQIKVGDDLGSSIEQVVQEQGGWNSFIDKGDRVFLKPNFNTADPYPGSTDPEFLKEVIKQILPLEPKEIVVADSSTMMAKTEEVFEKLGIYELENIGDKVKVVNLDQGKWIKKDIPRGEYLKRVSIPEILERVDKLILLSCLKTHFLARYTGALKLSVGLMKPRERVALHALHLQQKIGELNAVINPDLVIMDARTCFIDKGPMDGPRENPALILASKGRVELDQEGVKIIQSYPGNSLSDIKPQELEQIKTARKLNIR